MYRYNDDSNTPFQHVNRTLWDYDAKAVKSTTHLGVYGFTAEQVRLGRCNYFMGAFSDSVILRRPIKFLELEVDRNKVFHSDDMEVVFTEANFIKEVSMAELKALFPIYASVFDLYSEMVASNFEKEEAFIMPAIHEGRRLENLIPSIGNVELPIHGIAHGIRVERNGNMLCQLMGVNNRVVRPFAYCHDFCRENDGTDPEHGLRAANHIEAHREFYKFHFGLSETEVNLLKFACEHHTDMVRSDYEIVNICFDADRLDLPRVGITPDPNYMATPMGGMYDMSLQRPNN
ncbi:MAG: hypothetical protein F9K49_02550 [Caedimonadaceae bacterium]|nr:MAG: hypothetical protein F9K49_02550 [Caedimonadaceae bacterium]